VPAQAQQDRDGPRGKHPAHAKVAQDLGEGVNAQTPRQARWLREAQPGRRMVQVVVTSDSDDPELTARRQWIVRAGGEVHMRHSLINGLTATLPARRIHQLAERDDVVHVSPNRETRSTASLLEKITGALGSNGRTGSTKGTYTGFDGSGVGIAIIDSGINKGHLAFRDQGNVSRVIKSVTMLTSSASNWTNNTGVSTPEPNSTAWNAWNSAVENGGASIADGYGHGTHVAAVAAGFAKQVSSTTPDITGIAPNARLFDVKVIGDNGTGTVSDAIEGIQWVVHHARAHNIKVINLSIAADSTDSWRVDPLCAAARAAVASGITVVVAAGNYGRDNQGREVFGRIGSPGHEPSVITVGATNFKATEARGDDVTAGFSSRGPTRGAYVSSAGTVRDNALKPDLVAPGNRIVSAASVNGATWNQLGATYAADLVTPLAVTQKANEQVMQLSGTSVAAPAVAGAAALMLQANPGLTPPLVKAILQYSALPLPGASLVEQGAGALNVEGAMAMSRALRTDLWTLIDQGLLPVGSPLRAAGKSLPVPQTNHAGTNYNWSRMVFVGGNYIVSGTNARRRRCATGWSPAAGST
jgi:subtilisin family serine protease